MVGISLEGVSENELVWDHSRGGREEKKGKSRVDQKNG